ncbi:uncharacterized protein LOC129594792 [Paramacrobiotus metropolitanus]|uniref:uncharacterized protein LOC129594792 n=1 Tax=Paramacrobiotus metropolitanus TaxID=2943436 RepID=UPI0024459516|nr:uncharacterized protein LOC129594792 [Paramacrobiotus metropolitanus]
MGSRTFPTANGGRNPASSAAGYKVFFGIINKKNEPDMERIGVQFLKRFGLKPAHYIQLKPHLQGFEVTFRTKKDALSAVDHCDEGSLADAWKGSVTARLFQINEEADSVVSRMQRELWIFPDQSISEEARMEDVLKIVEFWQKAGICPRLDDKDKPTPEQEDAFRRGLLGIPTLKNQNIMPNYGAKTVVRTLSSEAAIAASVNPLPDEFFQVFDGRGFVITCSRPCEFKHRHDGESAVLHLPTKWRTSFDEILLPKWLDELNAKSGIDAHKLQEKVRHPTMHQFLGFRDGKERERFIAAVEKHMPTYLEVPVRALRWSDSILYDFKGVLSEDDRADLVSIIEGSPEMLKKLQDRPVFRSGNGGGGSAGTNHCNEIARMSWWSCYLQLNVCANQDILFTVERPRGGNMDKVTVDFSVLLVFTEGYFQAALKRAATIRKFVPQLEDMILLFKAGGGMIMNEHLSFDSLGRITFYLWFPSLDDAIAAYRMITPEDAKARPRFSIRDVIQQHEGAKVRTGASLDTGFSVTFPKGEWYVKMDLKEIARKAEAR